MSMFIYYSSYQFTCLFFLLGAGVPTTVRDAEHVLSKTRRPHEPEPVFPKTHIGAVNAVNYRPGGGYRKRQGTDSGSSFEDLEDDYNEMTLKSF